MTIKETINNYTQHNLENADFLERSARENADPDKRIPLFKEKLKQTQFNPALALDFASLLQLSDDSTNYDQYDLDDMRKLFDSLVLLQPYNLDVYVEYAHFEWSVMNNKNKAEELIAIGVAKANEKVEALNELQQSINTYLN